MALEAVEWEACMLEPLLEPLRDQQLEAYLRHELGTVPSCAPYFATSPWIVRSLATVGQYQVGLVHTDFALADLIGLVVSQDNSCRYCYATQRTLMRIQGVSEARLRQLDRDLFAAEIDPRQRSALESARRISRASPLASSLNRPQLRAAGYAEPAIKELAFVAASHVYFNRIATLPAIPPQRPERIAGHWLLRFLAPLARRVLRSHQRRGKPEPLPTELRSGPYAYLVLAFGDLPAARALRRLLDEAWASPILSPRLKHLVFAVVARALGCSLAEGEATQLLVEGGLAAHEVEGILTHLGSPQLDSSESAIILFARETIRYQPAQIQRRARAVRERVPAEEFVEVIGLCALANAVCRLDVIADPA